MPYDYRNDPALKPTTAREIDWSALVRQRWGKDWNKPETAYEFSDGRKFVEWMPAHARAE